MGSVLTSDIFFFVSTIALVFISVLIIVGLVYAIQFIKDIRYISRRAKEESDKIADDIEELRLKAKQDGLRTRYIVHFFKKIFRRRSRGRVKS